MQNGRRTELAALHFSFCILHSSFCISRGPMPDHDPKKTLSEISHLFLSSIRDKQTNGAPRPTRTPPQQQATPEAASQAVPQMPPPPHQGLPAREPGGPWSGMNIDLTAEEMAHVSHAAPTLEGHSSP